MTEAAPGPVWLALSYMPNGHPRLTDQIATVIADRRAGDGR
jgi:hypothetical protein